jgi:hypothetical protein
LQKLAKEHVRPIELPVFEFRLSKVEVSDIVGRIQSTIDRDVLSKLIAVATLRPSGGKREVGRGVVGAFSLASIEKLNRSAGIALFEFAMGEGLIKPEPIGGCSAACQADPNGKDQADKEIGRPDSHADGLLHLS